MDMDQNNNEPKQEKEDITKLEQPSGAVPQNQSQSQYGGPYQNQSQSQYGGPYQNQSQDQYGGPYQNQSQNQFGGPYQNQPQNQYGGPYRYRPQKQYDEYYSRDAKRTISHAGMALFLLAVALIVSQSVIDSLVSITIPSVVKSDWYIWALTALTLIGISFPLYYLFMKKIPDSPKGEVVRLKPLRFIKIFFICMSAMYITNILSSILTFMIALLKGETELINPAAEAILNSNLLLSLLYAAVVAPVIEELIFRKILLDKLRRFGDIPAIVMTGIAFGLFHMNLSQFFYAAVIGVIFAYVTIKTNTVRYAILLHMMINFLSTVVATFISDKNLIGVVFLNIWILGSIATGIILFFMNLKKIKFDKANLPLRVSNYFLNVGVILYTLVCLIMIAAITLAKG